MARRLNMYGFSLGQMRRLCKSGDRESLAQLRQQAETRYHYLPPATREAVQGVLDRAVVSGVPFPDLQEETFVHSIAATLLGSHGQEWLVTEASNWHATALERGLWPECIDHGSMEALAFLGQLVEGTPIFGCRAPSDGSAYAAVGLDSLRASLSGLRDLADTLARRANGNGEGQTAAEFAGEMCGWVEQIVGAGRDLYFTFG